MLPSIVAIITETQFVKSIFSRMVCVLVNMTSWIISNVVDLYNTFLEKMQYGAESC